VKELQAEASGETTAPPERCFELLADVQGYPRWYPQAVRHAEALESGRARVTLHVAQGPLVRDFDLVFDVHEHHPDRIELARVPHDASDPERFEVSWQIDPIATGSRLRLRLYGNLDLPRFLPIGGVADSIAGGFLASATKALSGSQA
jgi:uncharacterized protein YndB with AHSA1/START domain